MAEKAEKKDMRLAALRRFATAITLLNVLGHTVLGFEQSLAQPLVALLVAYSTEILLEVLESRRLGRKPRFLGPGTTFLDFMLSDAQSLLLGRDFTPTNIKVKPLDIPFKVVDPALVLDQGDKWQKLYEEIVVKQAR